MSTEKRSSDSVSEQRQEKKSDGKVELRGIDLVPSLSKAASIRDEHAVVPKREGVGRNVPATTWPRGDASPSDLGSVDARVGDSSEATPECPVWCSVDQKCNRCRAAAERTNEVKANDEPLPNESETLPEAQAMGGHVASPHVDQERRVSALDSAAPGVPVSLAVLRVPDVPGVARAEVTRCAERVWDNGDMTDCGRVLPCEQHPAREVEADRVLDAIRRLVYKRYEAGEKHTDRLSAVATLVARVDKASPTYSEGGWLWQGSIVLCPECKAVREGTVSWCLAHNKTCSWRPAGLQTDYPNHARVDELETALRSCLATCEDCGAFATWSARNPTAYGFDPKFCDSCKTSREIERLTSGRREGELAFSSWVALKRNRELIAIYSASAGTGQRIDSAKT